MIPLVVVISLLAGVVAVSQGGEEPPQSVKPVAPVPYVFGSSVCASCHNQIKNPSFNDADLASFMCGMSEFAIFNEQDKHRLAYKALEGPRGREMTRLLGTDVTKIDACINCHSVPDRLSTRQNYEQTEGVTCVACHGLYADWVKQHFETKSTWRALDRNQKETRYGMTDLWNPVRRAETCGSCHIGNHAEGKVITHAMYAAGHPPLPSLETASFGDAEPRHWETFREKSPARRQLSNPTPNPSNLETAQLAVIGGLVNLKMSSKLLIDEAAASKPSTVGAAWPDFARFDCYACHHELARADGASWRQLRARGRSPGRPTVPEWPMALVRVGIQSAAPAVAKSREASLNDLLAPFEQSLKNRPFGDTQTLISTARGISAWADALIADLETTVFDAAKARDVLDKLCKLATTTIPDYDSARQIAWTFRVIHRELTPKPQADPEIDRELAALTAELALDLPPSRTKEFIAQGESFAERSRSITSFAPARFHAHFVVIARRLAGLPLAQTAGR
jgi:hypothetical protein